MSQVNNQNSKSGRSGAPEFAPVILAGGSGTRFWPRSRRARAKQVLALDGERTMIQQTVDRLRLLADESDIWVITNELLGETIAAQLLEVSAEKILCESCARNTAPAIGLAAFLLEKKSPETVMGIFPSDHVVKDSARFAEVMRAGVELAAAGDNMVVFGVPPSRPETGYGYIETGEEFFFSPFAENAKDGAPGRDGEHAIPIHHVKRFTEKPDAKRAQEFLDAGNYAWNSGIFLWSAKTFVKALRQHCPQMATLLEKIAEAHGTGEFEQVFAELYPQCESISVDYAVLEPRSRKKEPRLYCLPAEFGWNDLGSWAALHEHKSESGATDADTNVLDAANALTLESQGNYVFAPGRTVALVGVKDLVVVDTGDALLITTREQSQNVGKVVKMLEESGKDELI